MIAAAGLDDNRARRLAKSQNELFGSSLAFFFLSSRSRLEESGYTGREVTGQAQSLLQDRLREQDSDPEPLKKIEMMRRK